MMKISENGISLIKSFEGLRLKAYKAVSTEEYYTIGYGHYGADVAKDMVITAHQAEVYLKADLAKYEGYVNTTVKTFAPNQNQFDALVSFTYNCGLESLKRLTNGRTAEQVAEHITAYVYSGGKKLEGLVKRRNAEKALFLKESEGLTMTQYEELKAMLEDLKPKYYDWTTACPEWSRKYVHRALELGIIKGDSEGRLRLTDDRIWSLVTMLRANGIMD